jgi:hypothetical protein
MVSARRIARLSAGIRLRLSSQLRSPNRVQPKAVVALLIAVQGREKSMRGNGALTSFFNPRREGYG